MTDVGVVIRNQKFAIRNAVAPRIRRPVVAGYYYPADPATLRNAVDALMPHERTLSPAHAVIVPHGSYHRAGAVIGAALGAIAIPRRCIILGASHTGTWMPWSLMSSGWYRTPLGDVPIDEALAEALRVRCPFLEEGAQPHRGEHVIEVLLPFLQRRRPTDLAIVPIIVGSENDAEWTHCAEALAQVVRLTEEPVLLIASTDLSHYETQVRGHDADHRLIDAICALDRTALTRTVREESVRMCGHGATVCVLEAATALGATRGRLAKYATSAAADGDPNSTIGYAGIIL